MKQQMAWVAVLFVITSVWAERALSESGTSDGYRRIDARVMEVAKDCTWMVVAERKVLLPGYKSEIIFIPEPTLTEDGEVLKKKRRCPYRVGERVEVKGFVIPGEGIFAESVVKK